MILLQNDTGTALVLLALIPIILFWSGLPYGISVFMVAPAVIGYFTVFHWAWGLLATIIITSIVFVVQRHLWLVIAQFVSGLTLVGAINIILESVLKPYQVARIKSFVNPAFDPKGNGWNIIQAKTAIGSGGITGKGFMEGTQTQLRFLPEQWTDFIFCVISEEFGFIGGALTIILFMFLLLRLLNIAGTHKHPFAQLVIVGIAGVYFVHMLINLSSASGLLPVIGIPLPFVSYGGSAFITNSLMLAICLNFELYHREFSIYA
jgi:rod shape determining protein RodA